MVLDPLLQQPFFFRLNIVRTWINFRYIVSYYIPIKRHAFSLYAVYFSHISQTSKAKGPRKRETIKCYGQWLKDFCWSNKMEKRERRQKGAKDHERSRTQEKLTPKAHVNMAYLASHQDSFHPMAIPKARYDPFIDEFLLVVWYSPSFSPGSGNVEISNNPRKLWDCS